MRSNLNPRTPSDLASTADEVKREVAQMDQEIGELRKIQAEFEEGDEGYTEGAKMIERYQDAICGWMDFYHRIVSGVKN